MKDGFLTTKSVSFSLSSLKLALLFAFAMPLLFSGCQQPVTNSQARRPSLFPSLFGPNGGAQSYASNNSNRSFGGQQSYLGASQLPSPQTAYGQGEANQGIQNRQQYAAISNELQGMNQRLNAYDSDNQLLNTEVASLKQKLQLSNQYSQTLKEQLADTSGRIQQAEFEKQSAIQQLASAKMQMNQTIRTAQNQSSRQGFSNQVRAQQVGFNGGAAPSKFGGGATIRANNSLMQQFASIRIPGGQARMDGDVIRIEFPTDRLFVQGTYQIQPAQQPLLQSIVGTIRQNFPRQIVGIEAHWDNTPLNPSTTTHHQLTATQALAVFDQMVRLGLPRNQMFTMAMASNRPRHPQGVSGGVSPNRRIELVIYPETYDGT